MSGDLKEGIESSSGDPRVLLVLNLLLSFSFAYMLVWLAELASLVSFSWEQVFVLGAILVVLTLIVVRE